MRTITVSKSLTRSAAPFCTGGCTMSLNVQRAERWSLPFSGLTVRYRAPDGVRGQIPVQSVRFERRSVQFLPRYDAAEPGVGVDVALFFSVAAQRTVNDFVEFRGSLKAGHATQRRWCAITVAEQWSKRIRANHQ